MCQMCEEYEAELRRLGVAMDREITVRLNDEIADELEKRAQAHGHNVADEARNILADQVKKTESAGADVVSEFARIRAMTPKGDTQTPAWKIIREERDRR
jgi:plasmid stability protein